MAKKASSTQRGYGATHQKRRRQLLAQHPNGAPCPECGQPLYREPHRNWDNAPPEADHGPGHALKHATNKQATLATRLLHRTCNRRGGAWDKPPKHNTHNNTTTQQTFTWGTPAKTGTPKS